MKKLLPLIIFLVIALGAGLYFLFFFETAQNSLDQENNKIIPEINNTRDDSQSPEANDSDVQNGYTDYDESKLPFARDGDVVLFFYAGWCPSCRELDANLVEDRNDIPDDLLIMKVNFDSSTQLKIKYGVTLQHTLVQVDENGDKIKLWNGLYSQYELSDILNEIN
jgi:thiol-disulfide isomerase/thioredoxin